MSVEYICIYINSYIIDTNVNLKSILKTLIEFIN